jgi:rhodanese-related sulfurtransferase
MQVLTAKDLHEKMKQSNDYVIVDIREPYECEVGRIASIHIPMGELIARQDELNDDKKIVLMCKSGKRAEAAANLLTTEFNKYNIYVLEGGISAWRDTVNPDLKID